MEWWSMTPTEVLKKLRTEERTGLSENEAKKRMEGTERNRERAKRAFGGGFWRSLMIL